MSTNLFYGQRQPREIDWQHFQELSPSEDLVGALEDAAQRQAPTEIVDDLCQRLAEKLCSQQLPQADASPASQAEDQAIKVWLAANLKDLLDSGQPLSEARPEVALLELAAPGPRVIELCQRLQNRGKQAVEELSISQRQALNRSKREGPPLSAGAKIIVKQLLSEAIGDKQERLRLVGGQLGLGALQLLAFEQEQSRTEHYSLLFPLPEDPKDYHAYLQRLTQSGNGVFLDKLERALLLPAKQEQIFKILNQRLKFNSPELKAQIDRYQGHPLLAEDLRLLTVSLWQSSS